MPHSDSCTIERSHLSPLRPAGKSERAEYRWPSTDEENFPPNTRGFLATCRHLQGAAVKKSCARWRCEMIPAPAHLHAFRRAHHATDPRQGRVRKLLAPQREKLFHSFRCAGKKKFVVLTIAKRLLVRNAIMTGQGIEIKEEAQAGGAGEAWEILCQAIRQIHHGRSDAQAC